MISLTDVDLFIKAACDVFLGKPPFIYLYAGDFDEVERQIVIKESRYIPERQLIYRGIKFIPLSQMKPGRMVASWDVIDERDWLPAVFVVGPHVAKRSIMQVDTHNILFLKMTERG